MTASSSRSILASLALAPAALLVVTGLFQSATGIEIAYADALRHPLLVLGGLAVALAVSAASALSLSLRHEEAGIDLTLRIRRQPLALAVLGAGLTFGAIIALYLVVETLAHAA